MRRALPVLLLLALLVAGCRSAPATEVREPRPYPDRRSAEGCWETFLWAWRTGDVPVLEEIYALWEREDLQEQIKNNGREKVSEHYRKDADSLVIEEARWDHSSDDLAYLTVRLGRPGRAPWQVRFSFFRRDDGWCLSGRR